MKKQLLIISLLSLFITSNSQAGVVQKFLNPEQIEILENLLHEQISYNKCKNFKDFNNLASIAVLLQEVQKISNIFMLRRLKETISHMCHLEKNLITAEFEEYNIQFKQMIETGNIQDLIYLFRSIDLSLQEYSILKLSLKYNTIYSHLECILAATQLNIFLLKYTEPESINSEEEFNKFTREALLLENMFYQGYLNKYQKNHFLEAINKLKTKTQSVHNLFFLFKQITLKDMNNLNQIFKFFPYYHDRDSTEFPAFLI